MNTIIFISGTPISKIEGKKLDPYWYCENGFHVEYWDVTRLYFDAGSLEKYFSGAEDFKFSFPNEREFHTKPDLKIALSEVGNDVIFSYVDCHMYSHLDYWLRRVFKKYDIKYFLGPKRTPDGTYRPVSRVSMLAKLMKSPQGFSDLCRKVYNRFAFEIKIAIYKYSDFYKKPDFVVGSGAIGRSGWINELRPRDYCSVPSVMVEFNEVPNIIGAKYCVYVDETVIFNADGYLGIGGHHCTSPCDDLEKYSRNICRVFDEVEREKGCRVVIAASGKYRYNDNKIFGGREIFYESTKQLIQHSCLVLGHNSSAVFQAIIDKKPVLIFTDPTFLEVKNIRSRWSAEFLGVKVLETTSFDRSMLGLSEIDEDYFEKLTELYYREKGVFGDAKSLIKDKILEFLA